MLSSLLWTVVATQFFCTFAKLLCNGATEIGLGIGYLETSPDKMQFIVSDDCKILTSAPHTTVSLCDDVSNSAWESGYHVNCETLEPGVYSTEVLSIETPKRKYGNCIKPYNQWNIFGPQPEHNFEENAVLPNCDSDKIQGSLIEFCCSPIGLDNAPEMKPPKIPPDLLVPGGSITSEVNDDDLLAGYEDWEIDG